MLIYVQWKLIERTNLINLMTCVSRTSVLRVAQLTDQTTLEQGVSNRKCTLGNMTPRTITFLICLKVTVLKIPAFVYEYYSLSVSEKISYTSNGEAKSHLPEQWKLLGNSFTGPNDCEENASLHISIEPKSNLRQGAPFPPYPRHHNHVESRTSTVNLFLLECFLEEWTNRNTDFFRAARKVLCCKEMIVDYKK